MHLEDTVRNCIGSMIENIDGYYINLDRKNFNITSDAINLFEFMIKDDISNGDILEIGPGSGYICLKLYKYNKNITAVEIQKDVYTSLKDNLNNNNNRVHIKLLNEDIKKHVGKYKYIVTNPPYYKLNSGKYPIEEIKKYSKFEFYLNLEDLCKNLNRLLLDETSVFYIVYPLNRKEEVKFELKKNNLHIIREKIIGSLYYVSGSKTFS